MKKTKKMQVVQYAYTIHTLKMYLYTLSAGVERKSQTLVNTYCCILIRKKDTQITAMPGGTPEGL